MRLHGETGIKTYSLVINTAVADTELIAAVTGTRYVVHAFALSSDVAQVASLVSDGSGDTEIFSWRFAIDTSGAIAGLVLPWNPAGWCQTALGEALDLRQASTNNIDGVIVVSKPTS